jgi:hypothetical protein
VDKLTRYREIIRKELAEYAVWTRRSGVTSELVEDSRRDHFELLSVGWEGQRRRIHPLVFHLDIIDGKVWLQRDGTNRPVARELVDAGIPKEDIVLAEKPPEVRPFTGYGVA